MTTFNEADVRRDGAGKFAQQGRTAPDPFERVRDARAEIVAGSMSSIHDAVTNSISDISALRMVNNDEGEVFFEFKRPGDTGWQEIEPYQFETPDGQCLADALYDETAGGSINVKALGELEKYAAGGPHRPSLLFPDSMKVNRHTNAIDSIELDLDVMRTAIDQFAPAAPAPAVTVDAVIADIDMDAFAKANWYDDKVKAVEKALNSRGVDLRVNWGDQATTVSVPIGDGYSISKSISPFEWANGPDTDLDDQPALARRITAGLIDVHADLHARANGAQPW